MKSGLTVYFWQTNEGIPASIDWTNQSEMLEGIKVKSSTLVADWSVEFSYSFQ